MDLSNPVIEWILKKVAGITIATEPEFCGGLKQSNHFLNIIDQLYFKPSLFHNIPNSRGTQCWKNLETYLADPKNDVQMLIVTSFDRISRNEEQILLKMDFLEKQFNIKLVRVSKQKAFTI